MHYNPTIVFDLDGTLADTIRDLVPCLNRTIATRNLEPVTKKQVGHVCGEGIKAMIKLAYALNHKTIETSLLDHLFDVYMEDYAHNLAVDTILYHGVQQCLQRFASNQWRLAVCTNKSARLADKLLQQLGVREMFHALTGGDSFDFKKPDPRHLIRTIEMAGGSSSKAIMVGDSHNDILTAYNANIPIIAVDFGYSKHPVARYHPDCILSSFDDLFTKAATLTEQQSKNSIDA